MAQARKSDLTNRQSFSIEDATFHALDFIGVTSGVRGATAIGKPGSAELLGRDVRVAIIDSALTEVPESDFQNCSKQPTKNTIHNCERRTVLSSHGVFCSSLIAGKVNCVAFDGNCEPLCSGVMPTADLYTYATGCSFCGNNSEFIHRAIDQAKQDQVDIISMTQQVIQERHTNFSEDQIGLQTLDACRSGIVTCLPAGDNGPVSETLCYGMPWCMNVGACTLGKTLVTEVEIGIKGKVPSDVKILGEKGDVSIIDRFQGISFNLINTDIFYRLRILNESKGKESILYHCTNNTRNAIVHKVELRAADPTYSNYIDMLKLTPTLLTSVSVVKCDQLWSWRNKFGTSRILYVRVSESRFVDDQRGVYVPQFSSKGPSHLYENIIMPDVVAPGYGIVAHMPIDIDTTTSDVPIPAKDIFEDKFKRQMILSGTSIASSFVAGAIAILKKYRSWSIFAIKSALVTTAQSLASMGVPGDGFSYGAGVIQVRKALYPGLVYDEEITNFESYVNKQVDVYYVNKQVDVYYVNKQVDVYCLNLPSFAASFSFSHESCSRVFSRRLTNVTGRRMKYVSKIVYFNNTLDKDVEISVVPDSLTFVPGETREFELKVQLRPCPIGRISAALVWMPMIRVRQRLHQVKRRWIPDEHYHEVVSPICLYHRSPYDNLVLYE